MSKREAQNTITAAGISIALLSAVIIFAPEFLGVPLIVVGDPGDGGIIEPAQIMHNTCTVASATTVTADECDIIQITGSTTIETLNTCEIGRMVWLICPDSSGLQWTIDSDAAGGNIDLFSEYDFQCNRTSSGVVDSIVLGCYATTGDWQEISRNRAPPIDASNQLTWNGTHIFASPTVTYTGTVPNSAFIALTNTATVSSGWLTDTTNTGTITHWYCDAQDTGGADCQGIKRYLHAVDIFETYIGGGLGNLQADYKEHNDYFNMMNSRISLNDESTCAFHDTDRWFGDTDCDSTLDSGETYFDGYRMLINAADSTITGDQYLQIGGAGMSATRGIAVMYSGSIIAVSAVADVTIHSGTGVLDIEVVYDGVNVFEATQSITGTGVWHFLATQAAGVDTIVATTQGEAASVTEHRISINVDFNSGLSATIGSIHASVMIEHDAM